MEPIEIKGLDRLQKIVDQAGDKALTAIAQGLYLEAQMAFNESQTLVPIDTGILKSSGHITSPKMDENSVEIIKDIHKSKNEELPVTRGAQNKNGNLNKNLISI